MVDVIERNAVVPRVAILPPPAPTKADTAVCQVVDVIVRNQSVTHVARG
eukprot:COSAG01_NODE_29220_length_642_cov_1.602210_1_plen_48_part_10